MTGPPDEDAGSVREVLARLLPGTPVGTVTRLGAGLENTAYDVDGRLVLRRHREPDAAVRAVRVGREARLLRLVAGWSPLPVPEPVLVAAELGWLGYPRLPGRPLLTLPAPRRAALARPVGAALGGLVAALQAVPAAAAAEVADVDETTPAQLLAEARRLAPRVEPALPPRYRAAVHAFLDAAAPPPAAHHVLAHDDLGIEHVLVDPGTGRVTGILDWTDAAVTDPARDLGRVLRDLGPRALAAALARCPAAGEDRGALLARVRFSARCGLLEDLAHGLDGGGAAYVGKSLLGLGRLFPA